jgi:hypothetical protein
MFKGTTGPQSGRTSRTQAEDIGADAEGFAEQKGYNNQGGHPLGNGLKNDQYSENVTTTPTESGAKFDPSPFSITSK